jgi:hypothetical protein
MILIDDTQCFCARTWIVASRASHHDSHAKTGDVLPVRGGSHPVLNLPLVSTPRSNRG